MLPTTDNLNLYTKNYIINAPKARVLIVHGYAEHCERYAHVAQALNAIGADVYTFDLRGHGQSEGEQAFVTDLDAYRQDVEAVYETIPKNLPLFVIGHSMGGLITFQFLMHQPRPDVRGAVLSGPALEIGEDVTPITKTLVLFLAKFFPKLKTVKLDANGISRDKAEVEKYKNDPLNYTGGTKAGFGVAFLNAIDNAKTKFGAFSYPVLIMHGEADKLTNPEGSKALYTQSNSADKTLKIWEGAFHEIFNETNKTEVIKTMTDWISTRI